MRRPYSPRDEVVVERKQHQPATRGQCNQVQQQKRWLAIGRQSAGVITTGQRCQKNSNDRAPDIDRRTEMNCQHPAAGHFEPHQYRARDKNQALKPPTRDCGDGFFLGVFGNIFNWDEHAFRISVDRVEPVRGTQLCSLIGLAFKTAVQCTIESS